MPIRPASLLHDNLGGAPRESDLGKAMMMDDRKRILAIDGGGVRGIFTMEILAQIQNRLREHYGNPRLVLADHFNIIAGSSIGGMIAAYLAWGESVERIIYLFLKYVDRIFIRARVFAYLKGYVYDPSNLADFLLSHFKEDNGTSALLGTAKLRTLLLLALRNASTGSAWPVTNNPNAKFNRRDLPDCNLNVPLWKLVRATTAAPFFFPPEEITLGEQRFLFVDGGITPYNNPSVVSVFNTTLPCYGLNWEAGTDKLLLVSVGAGSTRSVLCKEQSHWTFFRQQVEMVPGGLMETIALQQDMICRVLGNCIFGAPIDSEVGALTGEHNTHKRFTYVRYDHLFTRQEIEAIEETTGEKCTLNNIKSIPYLRDLGSAYAAANVKIEHLR
jgi:hypothetical protein